MSLAGKTGSGRPLVAREVAHEQFKCPHCKETKRRSGFYEAKRKHTGVSHYCRECTRELRRGERRGVRAFEVRGRGKPESLGSSESSGRPGPDRRWSNGAVVEAIQLWADEHGTPPSESYWYSPPSGFPSTSVVRDRFGTWNAAITAAGFKPTPPGGPKLRESNPKENP